RKIGVQKRAVHIQVELHDAYLSLSCENNVIDCEISPSVRGRSLEHHTLLDVKVSTEEPVQRRAELFELHVCKVSERPQIDPQKGHRASSHIADSTDQRPVPAEDKSAVRFLRDRSRNNMSRLVLLRDYRLPAVLFTVVQDLVRDRIVRIFQLIRDNVKTVHVRTSILPVFQTLCQPRSQDQRLLLRLPRADISSGGSDIQYFPPVLGSARNQWPGL